MTRQQQGRKPGTATPEHTPAAPPLDAYAPSTRATYASAWQQFTRWLAKQPDSPTLPVSPETLLDYLQQLATSGRRWSTIETHRAVIARTHRMAGLPNPAEGHEFKDRLKKLARETGRHQEQVQALTSTAQAAIDATAAIPRRGKGGRTETDEEAQTRAHFDRTLISVMREGMLRCGEAAALLWEDLDLAPDGTGRVLIRRSKTDQEGHGALVFLSRTSMTALDELRGQQKGQDRIFPLSSKQLRRRIQDAAHAAGLKGHFGGHSPRIGMAVDLAQAGTGLPEIQNAGRWKSPTMPAHYIRGITAGQGAVARYCQTQNR